MELEGKTAIVTGASSGIGAATVRKLRGAGVRVAGGARRVERIEADLALPLDVTDEESCAAFVGRAANELGGIDILFNNAGLALGRYPFWESTPEDEATVLHTNVDGVLRMTRFFSATDPNLAGLPIVIAKKRRPRLESDLPEFRDEEPQQLKFKNWTTSWSSGRPPENSIADAFAALQDDPTPRLNQRARERVEALTAAWTTPALDWFGRDFSRGALRAIHERFPRSEERRVGKECRL